MRLKLLFPLLLVVSLSSCSNADIAITDRLYYFDTVIEYSVTDGEEDNKKDLKELFKYYSQISDNYEHVLGIHNICSINDTNEDIKLDEKLYNMLEAAFTVNEVGANYFNPLCGSLAKKWKEALDNNVVLSNEVITSELNKINNSSLLFKDDFTVQRIGEGEIDLGGIAKGYVLDEVYSYLIEKGFNHYLINAGQSSILLGEKNTKDGLYNVGIDPNIIPNAYLKLKNCFVSTSSLSVQGKEIDGTMYSHIINPINGSAINNFDAVIVISEIGFLGDALSTSMMMNTLEEIKEIEKEQEVMTLVIKDKKVLYHHPDIEVFHK